MAWLIVCCVRQGYKVVGVDVQEPNQADDKLSLESFLFVTADVSDPAQAKHAITEAAQWCGNQIHVLINNAGSNFSQFPKWLIV